MHFIIKLFAKLLTPAANRFHHTLKNPQASQQAVQKEIFKRFVKSEYGKSLNIESLPDWHQIPIVTYDDIEKWILQQKETKKPLLTPESILFYEKTSGSRGAAKLIPYTKSLLSSFNQMFCVWAHDLIVHGANFSTGKIYFCISPQLGEKQDEIGLNNDSEYLDGWLKWFISPFLISPPGLNRVSDAEEFKNQLSQTLLLEENLEIISIWSPSFIKVILDYIQTNRTRLLLEIGDRLSPQRRKMLLNTDIPWTQLWQELKLISCWDSANAADGAEFLRSLFPNVLVQGKGLLATEAPLTIPLIEAQGYVPMLNEVFFEFEDEAGKISRLHELEKNGVYEIIISQKGGLYRYRIGDRIRVTHFYLNTPCLQFLGRTQEISDLVGEKLHSEFVRQVLDSLPLQGTSFKSLVPVKEPQHYILLLDQTNVNPQELAQQLDDALQQSPQYRHARLLNQLQPVRVLVSSQIPEIVALYKTRSGKKWGDLKHDILSTTPIESELLALIGERNDECK
ncbi:GH3 auxin-responsive promoter family protein [Plectonema radiosum NIES-515]|uniref:GH3 auxin-responsive promoter family protein n=1 Tax=Plectonema radiosum NIES-515 TaxID=2986073 RepID=A0ABT3B3E6_9CYAN|nr:GH3 auxin-responsive promoter family protein [Plectonema radiosum]MCV3215902.1 GH3 auxin-responsive promoter family protein [Plectonema radiosum NIES-515]